ncbi:MAG: site-specific integrase [Planctomycetia bacterium]|nr:site-specific integrase [Planctomycetia bacterium]
MPGKTAPTLCRHKTRQLGYVTLNGREHYLGHWPTSRGKKPPPDVQAAYDELIGKWLAHGRQLPEERPPLTVNDVVLAYVKWVATHYVPRRQKDDQNRFIRSAASVVCELFGRTPAVEFGPKKLKAVRQAMVELDWCRNTVNAQIDRVKRMFKWAVAEEMVPGEVYHALRSVDGLRRGTPGVRDTEPVEPVAIETVEAVLPFLQPVTRAMVRVQLLTGMRPGELCQLRESDIDTTDPSGVWLFRPPQHKTQHHGHDRVVSIGPQAQEVLRAYIEAGEEYVFSPQAAERARNAERRASRKTPMTPSQAARKPKVNPKRPKRGRYDETSYRNAIYRACDRAFPPQGALARRPRESNTKWLERSTDEERAALTRWRSEHRWHSNQLRHTSATIIRKEYGIEAARAILGHSRLTTTEVYAEIDRLKAAGIMAKIG